MVFNIFHLRYVNNQLPLRCVKLRKLAQTDQTPSNQNTFTENRPLHLNEIVQDNRRDKTIVYSHFHSYIALQCFLYLERKKRN